MTENRVVFELKGETELYFKLIITSNSKGNGEEFMTAGLHFFDIVFYT